MRINDLGEGAQCLGKIRLVLKTVVASSAILAAAPQAAIAESGCRLSNNICETLYVPYCIEEDECDVAAFHLPGHAE